jgi:glycosyltransferase involved in cell wall biosynthesis
MVLKMPIDFNFIRHSKVEFFRALDFLKITNMSHFSMLLSKFRGNSKTNNGRVIFCTRLWDPKNTNDEKERERRVSQNFFRINACRIIKANFPNSFVGVFDSELARRVCPELIFKSKILSKKEYLKELSKADICIADDGLKDSAGWKIGEYLMMGKAVISTPLNVYISDFYENKNYMVLTNRTAFEELTEKIDFLLKDDKYMEMGLNNKSWSEQYLFPNAYVENILKYLK